MVIVGAQESIPVGLLIRQVTGWPTIHTASLGFQTSRGAMRHITTGAGPISRINGSGFPKQLEHILVTHRRWSLFCRWVMRALAGWRSGPAILTCRVITIRTGSLSISDVATST